MITQFGATCKVFSVNGNKVRFTTTGDEKASAWFSIFEGEENIPKVGDFVKIKGFVFESIPVNNGGKKEYPVTLKVLNWTILNIPS